MGRNSNNNNKQSETLINTNESNGSESITIKVSDLRLIIQTEVSKLITSLSNDLAVRIDRIDETLLKIDNTTDKLQNEVCTFKAEIKELTKNLNTYKPIQAGTQITSTCSTNTIDVAQNVRDILFEKEEIEKKKNNIIMFNVKESHNLNREERKMSDSAKIIDLCDKIGINNVKENIVNSFRIGKYENQKDRPLLITLKDQGKRSDILKNARNLKNFRHDVSVHGISIKPDLTKTQQKEKRILVKELRDRKMKGEHVYIKHGKIVSAEPKVVESSE